MQKYIYTLIAGLILGALIVWQFYPRVEVRTETEEVVRRDVVTRIVERPDGGKETVIIDRSKESSTSTTEERPPRKWLASVGASTGDNLSRDFKYSASVQRRVVGPFFVGLQADTEGAVGVLLTMEF